MEINDFSKELILLLGGIGIIIIAYVKFKKQNNYSRYSELVKGVIYQIEFQLINPMERVFYVSIRFLTKNNDWVTTTIKDNTFPSLYKEGEKIDVRYNLEDPNDCIIASRKQMYLYICFGFLGFIMMVIGIIKLNRQV